MYSSTNRRRREAIPFVDIFFCLYRQKLQPIKRSAGRKFPPSSSSKNQNTTFVRVRRDFVLPNVGDWRGRPLRSSRLPRRAERWRVRDRERAVVPRMLRQSPRQRAAHHTAGVAVCPPSMYLVVFLGARTLSLCEDRKPGSAQAALLCPLHVPHHLPRGQRRRYRVRGCSQTRATPAPGYNASGSGFVSVASSPGACLQQRANPGPATGKTCSPAKQHSSTSSKTCHPVRRWRSGLILIPIPNT